MPAFITIPFFIIPELAKFISFHIHLSSVKRGIPLFRAKHPQQSSTANLRREVKHLDGARARYSKNTRVMLKFVSFAHLCKSLFSLKFETDPYLLKSKKKKKKVHLGQLKQVNQHSAGPFSKRRSLITPTAIYWYADFI